MRVGRIAHLALGAAALGIGQAVRVVPADEAKREAKPEPAKPPREQRNMPRANVPGGKRRAREVQP